MKQIQRKSEKILGWSVTNLMFLVSEEILHCSKAIITPDGASWNSYSPHYDENELSMLDWEANMMDERYGKKIKMEEEYIDISSITIKTK